MPSISTGSRKRSSPPGADAARGSRRFRGATASSTRRRPTPGAVLDGRRLAASDDGAWSYRLSAGRRAGPVPGGARTIGGEPMTRTVFTGARVFDGTGADPADADVAIEDGRIVGIGSGLDGDEAVDSTGGRSCPDSSTATPTSRSATSTSGGGPAAVLAPVLRGRPEPRGDAPSGITSDPRRRRRRPRDQGGRRRRPPDPGPRMQISLIMLTPDRRPRRRLVSVGRRPCRS